MSNPCCACLTAVAKVLIRCVAVVLAACVAGATLPAAAQTAPSLTGAQRVPTGRPAADGKAWATAALDSTTWPLGAQVALTIELRNAVAARAGGWVLPVLADSLPGGLEVVRPLGGDTATVAGEGGDWTVVQRRFLVTAWDTGFAELPPLPVVFGDDTAWTAAVPYRIVGPDVTPETPPMPPADLIEVRWTWWELLLRWLPWIAAAVALGFAGRWAWRRYRRRGEDAGKAHVEAEVVRAPHEVALARLERIQREAAWRMGDDKGHHAGISEVLRRYIEEQFGFPALERTTLEIRRGLRSLPLSEEDRTLLLSVLDLADMVKFAKLRTGPEDHERAVAQAIRFVHRTAPAGPPLSVDAP